MDDLRKERLAINESLFRNVNEGIRAGRGTPEEALPIRCECGVLGCTQLVEVPLAVYEAVRSHPRRFLLLKGHDFPEAERVVEHHEGFDVVEKYGETGDIAEVADPRSRDSGS